MEVNKVKATEPLIDLMEGCDRWEIDVDGQHGMVALVDIMPRMVPAGRTADAAVVQAARTSTGQGLKSPEEDRGLERFLYRHNHATPFEMINVKFHHVLPIFVARQLIRHRAASVNEYSLRYSEVKDRFWFPPSPESLRAQGASNKQHTEGGVDLQDAEAFILNLRTQRNTEITTYEEAIEAGVGRELARVGLPVNLYTEWYWEIDLRNLLHFLGLRQDKHAQKEIRDYADAMYMLIKPLVPVAVEAYDDYHPNRGGMLLSRLDIAGMTFGARSMSHSYDDLDILFSNTRELAEFKVKAEKLGNHDLAARAATLIAERAAKKSE